MITLTIKTEPPRPVHSTLTLPWNKRTRSRQRVILDNGEEARIFLERGTILRGGDVLVSEDGIGVQIVAAREKLSRVVSDDSLQLSRLCYHLGNRHVDLQIEPNTLAYPHDHVLDEMIQALGFDTHIHESPFEPENGAYDDTSRSHHHE